MLEVDRVLYRYPGMDLAFDLRVESGECTALVGPSGAGKSTLLSLIAGFVRPDEGRIAIDAVDVTAWPAARRPVTTIFQEHNLFAHLSAAANVGLGIDPGLGLDAGQRRRVHEALEQVGLEGFGNRLPNSLSGGERRRVALARALVRRRPVLLLDEPFAALGPALRREMLELVDRLRRDENLTVILVSHHPSDALLAASRTAFIHRGRILACEETARLLALAHPPEIAAYLGEAGGP